MNRLEGTVADDGVVAYGDKRLAIAAVRGRAKGERVMVLVRPETVELQPANGDGAGVITGEIVSHTFLGRDDAAEADLRRQRGDGRRAGHAGERLSRRA